MGRDRIVDVLNIKKQQTAHDEKSKREYMELARKFHEVFETTIEGRDVFDKLMEYCMVFQMTHREVPAWTSFNEGRRDVGLMILRLCGAAYDSELALLRERAKKRISEK